MKPIEKNGYDVVGNGWRFILEALDTVMENEIEHVRNQIRHRPSKASQNPEHSYVKIDQIKEKFGGLRVYYTPSNMSQEAMDVIEGAVKMAEQMAVRFCEHCGSNDEVINRGIKNVPRSWTLTLCRTCHVLRDRAWEEGGNQEWPPRDPIPGSELGINSTKGDK